MTLGLEDIFKKSTLPVGSESFSSQFDFCSSIPRADFDLLDRDLQFKKISTINSPKLINARAA